MKPAFDQLGLESNNVPHVDLRAETLPPREFDEAVGLAVATHEFASPAGPGNMTTADDGSGFSPACAGKAKRVVPLVLPRGSFPLNAQWSKDFSAAR